MKVAGRRRGETMQSTSPRPCRVLVVDNDGVSREMIAQLLEGAGFQVLQAGTGERALLTLRECGRRIDWLFTAIDLPGLVDGWIVGDEFRLAHPGRPVVFARSGDASPFPSDPGSVFVQKPLSPVDAFLAIKNLADPAPVRASSPVAAPLAMATG